MRQGGSGRKGVAFQEEEEVTTMTDGPRKHKQQCDGTLKRKDARYDERISRTFSRIAVRRKSIKFGKGNLKKITVLASEY